MDTACGNIVGLVLNMLSFRTCETSKRRCQESSWCTVMGLRGGIRGKKLKYESVMLIVHYNIIPQGKKRAYDKP